MVLLQFEIETKTLKSSACLWVLRRNLRVIFTSAININGGQEVSAQESLELSIGLAGTELRFLRSQLVEVAGREYFKCASQKGEEVTD
nr:importin-5-like [Tanacetum cinerariifolium]